MCRTSGEDAMFFEQGDLSHIQLDMLIICVHQIMIVFVQQIEIFIQLVYDYIAKGVLF